MPALLFLPCLFVISIAMLLQTHMSDQGICSLAVDCVICSSHGFLGCQIASAQVRMRCKYHSEGPPNFISPLNDRRPNL